MNPTIETTLMFVSLICLLHAWHEQGIEFFLLLAIPAFLLGIFQEQVLILLTDFYRFGDASLKIGKVPVVAGFWWSYLFYLALFLAEGIAGGSLKRRERVQAVLLMIPLTMAGIASFFYVLGSVFGLFQWQEKSLAGMVRLPAGIPLLLPIAHAGLAFLFFGIFSFLLTRPLGRYTRLVTFVLLIPLITALYLLWCWGTFEGISYLCGLGA